jgi:hypothetical protein
METERTWGMDSVRTSRPLGRTDRRMLRVGDGVAAGVGVRVAIMLLYCGIRGAGRLEKDDRGLARMNTDKASAGVGMTAQWRAGRRSY